MNARSFMSMIFVALLLFDAVSCNRKVEQSGESDFRNIYRGLESGKVTRIDEIVAVFGRPEISHDEGRFRESHFNVGNGRVLIIRSDDSGKVVSYNMIHAYAKMNRTSQNQ